MVSILDGLKLEKEWDYILTQQGSHQSGFIETYEPYLGKILNFVKNNSKFKHFGWQETWAYGKNMDWPNNQFAKYNRDPEIMYKKIHECVTQISENYKDLFIINSGDVVKNAFEELKINLYDNHDFHMNEIGCYLIGTNFIKLLLGEKVKNVYVPSNDVISKDICKRIFEFINKQEGFKK